MKTRILVKEGEYRLAKAYCMDCLLYTSDPWVKALLKWRKLRDS